MTNPFSAAQWLTWATVTLGQATVAVPAWRKREYALATYLTCLTSMSAIALCFVMAGSAQLYLKSYIVAGYVEIIATAALLLSLLGEMRRRARPGRDSCTLIGVLVVTACIAAATLCHLPPIPDPTVLTALRTHGYYAYTAMAFAVLLLPLYGFVILSFPKRDTVLKIIALSFVIAFHATLLDNLLNLPASSPQALKRLHDYAYLIPLFLWFVCTSPKRSPSGSPADLRFRTTEVTP